MFAIQININKSLSNLSGECRRKSKYFLFKLPRGYLVNNGNIFATWDFYVCDFSWNKCIEFHIVAAKNQENQIIVSYSVLFHFMWAVKKARTIC